AFAPKPMPSDIPAPIAITFFTAPPSCMPMKSLFAYTRKVLLQWIFSCRSATNSASGEATEIAVGRPIASSFANVGPDRTASE
ncbi:hypothetical protein D049_4478B, partial [Vibrio parahaemolyticus VPTS-2010]